MTDVPDSMQRRSAADEHVLRVYVAEHCGTCRESRRLAKVIAGRLKDITVETVDIDSQEPVDEIFAVPTFCYRGKILSLGNPLEEDLIARVLTLEQESERLALPRTSHQDSRRRFRGTDAPQLETGVPAEATAAASRGQIPVERNGRITACCGALGIGGAILCSLTMVAPALGLIAVQRTQPVMSGMSGPGQTSRAQLPAWWQAVVASGPEILVVSVLLVALAVALRRRAAALPAMVGGLILYLGMYVQPSLAMMYAAPILGIALLLFAYVAGLRPALGAVMAQPNQKITGMEGREG